MRKHTAYLLLEGHNGLCSTLRQTVLRSGHVNTAVLMCSYAQYVHGVPYSVMTHCCSLSHCSNSVKTVNLDASDETVQ